MFSDVDEHMEASSTLAMERSSRTGEDLFNIAVVREEDSLGVEHSAEHSDEEHQSNEECSAGRRNDSLGSTLGPDRGRIAFFNFDGVCFVEAGSSRFEGALGVDEEWGSSGCEKKSAFDLDSQSRSVAVEPLVRLAAGGIAAAVLLYESSNTEGRAFPYAKAAASRIRETLSAVTEEQRLKSLKYRKKRRVNRVVIEDNPAPKVVIFDVRTCLTFEDLNVQLRSLVCGEGSGTLSQGTYDVPYSPYSVYCTLFCSMLFLFLIEFCTTLYCAVLFCIALHSTVLYCTMTYCTVLCYIQRISWLLSVLSGFFSSRLPLPTTVSANTASLYSDIPSVSLFCLTIVLLTLQDRASYPAET
jgi:hypothetical protein